MTIVSVLKFLATSNTINFIIMVCFLVWIVKKINLNKTFDSSIEAVKYLIAKSEEEKLNSKKLLDDTTQLIEALPEKVAEFENISAEKLEFQKTEIQTSTDKIIAGIELGVNRAIEVEEKKLSNILTEKTALASIEIAKQQIIEILENNPELHNQFIQNSLDELDKVKL